MQISSSPTIISLPRQQDAQELLARQRGRLADEQNSNEERASAEQRSGTAAATLQSASVAERSFAHTRTVSTSNRSESLQFERLKNFSELPPQGRRALTTYNDIQQRRDTGPAIELAGIDVFV